MLRRIYLFIPILFYGVNKKIEEILEASIDDINVRTQINLALKLIHIRNFIKKDADFWNKKEL